MLVVGGVMLVVGWSYVGGGLELCWWWVGVILVTLELFWWWVGAMLVVGGVMLVVGWSYVGGGFESILVDYCQWIR